MPIETIIIMLAIPVAIVILFNLDFHKKEDNAPGEEAPPDDHPREGV